MADNKDNESTSLSSLPNPSFELIERSLEDLSSRIERLESSRGEQAPSHWSISRTEVSEYFNIQTKTRESHDPGFLRQVDYNLLPLPTLSLYVEKHFGPGNYAVELEDGIGRIISAHYINIAYQKHIPLHNVDRSLIYKIFLDLEKEDITEYRLEDIVLAVVSKIERNNALKVKGGFVDLNLISEDLDLEIDLVVAIAKKYASNKEGALGGLLNVKSILINSIGEIFFLKRKRWDWLPGF